jgi:hypothetical protein
MQTFTREEQQPVYSIEEVKERDNVGVRNDVRKDVRSEGRGDGTKQRTAMEELYQEGPGAPAAPVVEEKRGSKFSEASLGELMARRATQVPGVPGLQTK